MPPFCLASLISRLCLIAACMATVVAAVDLPYLPDELAPAFPPGLPKLLPKPVATGEFRKLPAGDGFVWLADCATAAEKGNQLAFSMEFDAEIKQDEVAFVAIRARTVRAPDLGLVRIHIAERKDMSKTALYHLAKIPREWGWYFLPFRAHKAIAAKSGKVRFSFDTQAQGIEIEETRFYVAPEGFDMSRLPMMESGYQGRELDAAWRSAADARIGEHRMGPLKIRVSAAGKPVADANVRVAMQRHAFGFGSTFNLKMFDDRNPNALPYRKTFDELFSMLVPSPTLIPRHTPRMHSGNYGNQQLLGLGRALQWATDRQMSLRGHTLVWGNLQPWSEEFVAAGTPDEILGFAKEHQQYVFALTKGIIHEWDAINHPIRFQKDLRDVFGNDIYRDIITRQRRGTDAALIINEALFDDAREDAFYEMMVQQQASAKARVDGVGFQSHYTAQNIRGMEDLWRRYERFAGLVDHLVITEYDLVCNDDELHADYLRDILTLSFSHPKMTGFVNWGFWAGLHWKPEGALIRKDWTERPAVDVWRNLVKGKWWTNTEFASDAEGLASTDAFYGFYEVIVTVGNTAFTQFITHGPNNYPIEINLP
ncbi:MAG: endo-1,4-beta-xylanase [Rhodothermales bacterium]|jgi:endo-1,4-beta-xylanase